MNIFKQLSEVVVNISNRRLYDSLKNWTGSVSNDVNEYSATSYPNGFKGFSFGDRLDAVIYITLAYLHKKLYYEGSVGNVFPIPGTDYEYWKRIIDASLEAIKLRTDYYDSSYEKVIKNLFGAAYTYSDWQSFITSTIGYFDDYDDETVKAFSFMFSDYHNYADDYNYQQRKLTTEEIEFVNNSSFYKFGLFDYILPKSVDIRYKDYPFIDRIYLRIFFPVWDVNNKYKQGDNIIVDENSEVIYNNDGDVCLII